MTICTATTKQRYRTLRGAHSAATHQVRRHGGAYRPTRCGACGGWHLARVIPSSVRERRRGYRDILRRRCLAVWSLYPRTSYRVIARDTGVAFSTVCEVAAELAADGFFAPWLVNVAHEIARPLPRRIVTAQAVYYLDDDL